MRILLSACLSAMLVTSAAADAVPRRPFTIDDMLAIRDVSEIDI